MSRRFGDLGAADLGMPFKHGRVEGVLSSVRHFLDGQGVRQVRVLVKVPKQPNDQRDHREVAAVATDPIGGAS